MKNSAKKISIIKDYKPTFKWVYIVVITYSEMQTHLFLYLKNLKYLISTIYANLQPVLENDLHYWLQRAKSIYRTSSSKEELDDAYTYAKKAYLDGNQSLSTKAALTSSLISCALSEVVELEKKLGYSEEAVILASEAVFSDYFRMNPNYLTAELPVGKNTHSERRISNACNDVISNSKNSNYIEKSKEILTEFEAMRKRNMKTTH